MYTFLYVGRERERERERDSGKIETKIDRPVPLFSMMLLTSRSSASCEARRIDVISSRASSLSLSFSLSLSLSLDSSSFYNLSFDTSGSHYSPLIYASRGQNYVPVPSPRTISSHFGAKFYNSNGSSRGNKNGFLDARINFRVVGPVGARTAAARSSLLTGCAFREQNYRRLARSITSSVTRSSLKVRRIVDARNFSKIAIVG